MSNAFKQDQMCKENAEIQQLERPSLCGPFGDLPGGTDRRESPSNDEPPLAINSARPEEHEPSPRGAGGSTVAGNEKCNLHLHQRDDMHLLKKLKDKEKEIEQLMVTMDYMTTKLDTHNKTVTEFEQLKKEFDELRNVNVNLELANRLLRSEVESFNYSRIKGQSPSLISEQQMGGTRALEGTMSDPLRSAQGSIVTAPEDDLYPSNDSFVFMPEPMNIDTRRTEDLSYQDEMTPLQLQIREHEDAYRKERNDRVMLKQKYRTLKRDYHVVSKDRDLALRRAELAEADARRAKEEASKLRERFERMRHVPGTRSASSSQRSSTVSSPHRGADPTPTRDPLTCVWPPNNYHLIMPPNYSQRGDQSQNRNSSPAEFELVARSTGEENVNSPEEFRPLEWDMGRSVTKRERSVSIVSSLEFDEIDDIKRNIKLDDAERWSCQACKYRNRARRSECDYCGTVDAEQRRRYNNRS